MNIHQARVLRCTFIAVWMPLSLGAACFRSRAHVDHIDIRFKTCEFSLWSASGISALQFAHSDGIALVSTFSLEKTSVPQLPPPRDFQLVDWGRLGFGSSVRRFGPNLQRLNVIICIPYWASIVTGVVLPTFYLRAGRTHLLSNGFTVFRSEMTLWQKHGELR